MAKLVDLDDRRKALFLRLSLENMVAIELLSNLTDQPVNSLDQRLAQAARTLMASFSEAELLEHLKQIDQDVERVARVK